MMEPIRWTRRVVDRLLKRPVTAPPKKVVDQPPVLAMLRSLGTALLETGHATNDVETRLRAIAGAHGVDDIRVVVLPTMLILQSGTTGRAEIATVEPGGVRLDQAGAVDAIGAAATEGVLDSAAVLGQIEEVRTSPPRFGPAMTVVGHTVLTVGFGLTLNPTASALPAYVLLGAAVGLLILLGKRVPSLANAIPVFASFLVALVTTLFLAGLVGDDILRIITPALVSFLPGLTLTIAAIELTSNQVVAGSSRLVFGVAQLFLLAFGVLAATTLVGDGPADVAGATLGWWAGPLGVVCVAAGYVIYLSAPRRSFLWIVLCLFVAFGAQGIGVPLLGAELSGFLGAAVVVPFAQFASRFRTAPPARVMTIAAFWLLVPGALGFIGVSEAADSQAGGLQTLASTGMSVFAIALGILFGTGFSRDAGRIKRRIAARRRKGDPATPRVRA